MSATGDDGPVHRVVVRHDVFDYDEWRARFDEWADSDGPADEGIRMHSVFQDETDPNNTTVLFDFDDAAAAEAFVMNPEHKVTLERHGVKPGGLLMSITEL